MKEALFYEKGKEKKVRCRLCPRNCLISEGSKGFCRVRKNSRGKLFSLAYGKPCAVHVDPIEKKPIYHMLPGHESFSIGTAGCNLNCKNCQNWEISQAELEDVPSADLSPEEVVKKALENGCKSIAYTYTEPTIFYEYALDIAKLAREKGLKNVMVTNGYINPEPLKKLYGYIDAANVDLKGYSEEFYQKICAAHLKPVLESLKLMKELGIWIEITNLLIPGYNDKLGIFEEMCVWIKENLGKDVPLHISRFFPYYKLLDVETTPEETLKKAYSLAKQHLEHVYLGNLLADKEDNTYCPNCGELLIERNGFKILKNKIKDGKCKGCGVEAKGIWR